MLYRVGRSGFFISARAENRCDDGGCIHKSLSRIALFFCLRDRPESVGDRTPYPQQTLGSSCVPWLYPHRVLVSMGHVGYALCPHPVLMTRGGRVHARPPAQLFSDNCLILDCNPYRSV